MTETRNSALIAGFVTGLYDADLPPAVIASARQSLIDWVAVCLAAHADPEALRVAEMVHAWGSQGLALALDGRTGSAAAIALVNGTYAHALDYDDFHIESVHHAGGPTFAAALAVATGRGLDGRALLRGFVAGFEVGVRLGMHGIGLGLGNAGWHPTGVLGSISAAIASAALLRLDPRRVERSVGFAAAQVGGLMSAAGTIAKPFLVGKAAMGGVMAAELAERDASVPANLLEAQGGVFATLLKQGAAPDLRGLGEEWQVLRNTFKPYSSCQLTHASIDAARAVAARLDPRRIASVRASVNPFALHIAGLEAPATALQGRFSLKHCIAMSLLGHGASPHDFTVERVLDPAVVQLRQRIETVPTEAIARTAARLEVMTVDGERITQTIDAASGSLERPMSMAETERKFVESTAAIAGLDAPAMLETLRRIDERGALEEFAGLLTAMRTGAAAPRAIAASTSR